MEGREISIYLGEIKLTPPQPVAWNFLTSGSVNFHATIAYMPFRTVT